jgi:hypothetical protein
VNVFVGADENGKPYSLAVGDWGSRLDADCASIGFRRATAREPRLGRYLREAGVAFRVKVTMKP